jgi:hypothetical protein
LEPKHRQGVLFIVSIDVIVLELCLSVGNDMQALWMSTNITLVQSLCESVQGNRLRKADLLRSVQCASAFLFCPVLPDSEKRFPRLLPACPYDKGSVKMKVTVEHW